MDFVFFVYKYKIIRPNPPLFGHYSFGQKISLNVQGKSTAAPPCKALFSPAFSKATLLLLPSFFAAFLYIYSILLYNCISPSPFPTHSEQGIKNLP